MDSSFDTTEAIRSWLKDFRGAVVRAYGQGYGAAPQDDHVLLFFDRPDGHNHTLPSGRCSATAVRRSR
jgi:hypothetical protein